jgi:hypothetical protein
MHDQGPLPEPKEGGYMAALLGCVRAGKEFNDAFLTEMIQEEKKHKQSEELDVVHPKKTKPN